MVTRRQLGRADPCRTRAARLYVLAALLAPTALGQPATAPVVGELVKKFDFDERRLGNFEDTPMYWQRLTGDGLPPYSAGRLDDETGHDAPPSFLFVVRGGSVAYEYTRDDLRVLPYTDYVVSGYVRADGLEWAHALIMSYLVDEDGSRIGGSERVTPLVSSSTAGGTAEPWQPVEMPVPVDHPSAAAIRLQLWVLQNYVFREPERTEVDPIVRQEVNARVWFDDIAVTRVPRARLRLSSPGGLVEPGAEETLQIDVQNATAGPLQIKLTVVDEGGSCRVRDSFELAAHAADQRSTPVSSGRDAHSTLAPGLYRAELRMTEGGSVRARRAIRFAVLPELSVRGEPWERLGVDLGRWPGGTVDGAADLITALGCGVVKVGVPMIGKPNDEEEAAVLRRPRELGQRLARQGIAMVGVIHPPAPGGDWGTRAAVRTVLAGGGGWAENVGPTLAYFGGVVTTWQLGREDWELNEPGGWDRRTLEAFDQRLERFVAVPRLVVPRSILDAPPAARVLDPVPPAEPPEADAEPPVAETSSAGCVYSYWVSGTLPAPALAWQLAFWLAGPDDAGRAAEERWLALGLDRERSVAHAERIADLARRVVLTAAVNPDRLFLPAPFDLASVGGYETWQPTDEYIPLRTLVAYLADSRAVTSLALEHDAVGILFKHPRRHTLVLWTWQADGDGSTVELDVGQSARAYRLDGTAQPLTFDGPRTKLALTSAPLIVDQVDAPLLLLPRTFQIEPRFLQTHEREPRPVLTLRNTYPVELTGTIELTPPATWSVAPTPIRLRLAPDEALVQPLDFEVPPREIATGQNLGVEIRIRQPAVVDLHLNVPLQIGLRDIRVEAELTWDGDDLIIEQSLANLSAEPVRFDGFCQPPQRAQLQGVFLEVPPGKTHTHTYHLGAARELAGQKIWLGLREIGGPRTLDQLVVVTP